MADQPQDTQKLMAQQLFMQQLQQLEQQIGSIEQQRVDLGSLKENIVELQKLKKVKIHTPLGAGVFLESEVKEVNDVLLGVGSGVIVKKEVSDAVKIIERQIVELEKISVQMQQELNNLTKHLELMQ
jgi:prefoldin alpha subunit